MPEIIAMGPLIVILIRLIVPLSIFRWPLLGGIASALADLLDVVMLDIINLGDFSNYTKIDKALDWYFLFFMAILAFRWKPNEKWTLIGLFFYRTIGVVIVELGGPRELLFVFPNFVLMFFLFVVIRDRFFPAYQLTKKRIAIALLIMLGPKLFQEWVLHIAQFPPWEWIKTSL